MDYRKYLKEGFQLKEFTIRTKSGKDAGSIWAECDAKCRELEDKANNGELLSDEEKLYIKRAIVFGTNYFNSLTASFSKDDTNGSQIERECAGLVDGKESIKDRVEIYKSLLEEEAKEPEEPIDTTSENTENTENIENAESTSQSQDSKLEVLKDAIVKEPDLLKHYKALRASYVELSQGSSTNTGADVVNNAIKNVDSAKVELINEFKRLNDKLNLQLSTIKEFDELVDKAESEVSETSETSEVPETASEVTTEVASEDTDTNESTEPDILDKVNEDKEDAFREYYIHKLKALEINKQYSDAVRARKSEEIARLSVQKENLATEENDILSTYRTVINTDIENIKAEQQLKGITSEAILEPIKSNEDLKKELEGYLSDEKYDSFKKDVEQSLKEEEALNSLVNGDSSQVVALANTFNTAFKSEQDIEVWRDCIYKYAKLLVAYNNLMKSAVDAGVIPSDLEKLQKYIRIASTIVTIASFIPGVQAVGLPLSMVAHTLRLAGGATTAALNTKKAISEFQNGNPKDGMKRIAGACLGAWAAYSGFKNLGTDITNLKTFNMLKPDKLAGIDFNQERANIDQKIANIDYSDPIKADSTLKELTAQKSLLDTQESALQIYNSDPQAYSNYMNDLWHNKIPGDELKKVINDTSKAFTNEAELAAQSTIQDNLEAKADEAMEKLPTLDSLRNMSEAEAREMANTWAADGGWYANVMAHGTADDQARAIYALRAINNSADGQAQIAAYKAMAKASEGITNANKIMGEIHSQQGELFADISKNVRGSVYDRVDNIVDDATSRKIVSGLYDLGTTKGINSQFTVGDVQKLITDSGVTDQATQQKLLKNICSGYKATMTTDTILSPRDTGLFERATRVSNGTVSAGKYVSEELANKSSELASSMSQWGTVAANNAEDYNIAKAKAGF